MKVVRYFFVGGTAALVDLGLFALGVRVFDLPYMPVAAGSFVVATLVNYVLSIRHVFESGVRFRKPAELSLVLLVSACGLVLNQAVLWFAVERLNVDLLVSKVGATGAVFFWNYGMRRSFIFRARRTDG